MIVTLDILRSEYGIIPEGVIHVGAHEGQEYQEYLSAGIENMMFFEPVEVNFMRLVHNVPISGKVQAFNMALGNMTGEIDMFIEKENKGMSCSILEPKLHLEQYNWITFKDKERVKIDSLDNISFKRSDFNILNIDVQGYELEVLKGATETLKSIDAIFIEVNKVEMYKGCALIADIDLFLSVHCFNRVADDCYQTWGEALYVKRNFIK